MKKPSLPIVASAPPEADKLPLPKGGIMPLFGKEGIGEIC
jgi:hypothetical protein